MNEKNRQTHSAFRRAGMLLALIVPLLTACGGGGGGDTPVPAPVLDQTTINNLVLDGTTSTNTATVSYTVGGTVNSLISGSGLVLQNNGADNLTISADGRFSFPQRVADGARYNVTVLTQPANQICAVTNASGTVSSADVANVTVSCHAGFSETGDLLTGRYWHTSTLLLNGKVLVAGGYDVNGHTTAKAELYDPATGTWTATGSMAQARESHTATLLPDGKVLVAGGYDGTHVGSAELYDPATGTWSQVGSLISARYGHSATLLKNGMVLVSGGGVATYALIAVSAELYDPATRTWTATGSMASKRTSHTATLLDTGEVLVAGGWDSENRLASAERYNPNTGAWTLATSMGFARDGHTMTKLPNGTVLVTGGSGNTVYDGSYFHAAAEVYDPVAGTWTTTGSMARKRVSHTATLLRNGKVLVAGGFDALNTHASAELYDPDSGTWSPTGGMKTARSRACAILLPTPALPEDRVLMAGGLSSPYPQQTALSSAELYW